MKRFWKTVSTEETEEGWRVLLDGRPVATPAKRPILVPVLAIADCIAREWSEQEGDVRPLQMPMTRTAATCLDRVEPNLAEIRHSVAGYAESDLLCYRAEFPTALNVRQQQAWNPILDWAADDLQAPLTPTQGIVHVQQPKESLHILAGHVASVDAWVLTALAELTQISGSLLLALAIHRGRLTASDAWTISRIDEQWNIEEWGEDAEAALQASKREADFHHSASVLEMLRRR